MSVERAANSSASNREHKIADLTATPRLVASPIDLFSVQQTPHLILYCEGVGFGWRPFPVGVALEQVVFVAGNSIQKPANDRSRSQSGERGIHWQHLEIPRVV